MTVRRKSTKRTSHGADAPTMKKVHTRSAAALLAGTAMAFTGLAGSSVAVFAPASMAQESRKATLEKPRRSDTGLVIAGTLTGRPSDRFAINLRARRCPSTYRSALKAGVPHASGRVDQGGRWRGEVAPEAIASRGRVCVVLEGRDGKGRVRTSRRYRLG